MTTWKDVEAAEPEFAARVRAIVAGRRHKTLATLRADGSPRLSGIETEFGGVELTFGSMPGARKGADLHRDPRCALHALSTDPPEGQEAAWAGDVRVSGRAVPAGPVPGEMPGEMFRVDVEEVVHTGLNAAATALVVETWTPGGGLRRVERA